MGIDFNKLNFEAIEDSISLQYADVRQFADAKLKEFGLTEKGWTFDFTSSKVTLGYCVWNKKQIQFSEYYMGITGDEIEDTILHEIAHALVGPNVQSHGWEWQAKAREVGARPERCAPAEIKSAAKPGFYYYCPPCDVKLLRHRLRNRKMYCGRCGGELLRYKRKG